MVLLSDVLFPPPTSMILEAENASSQKEGRRLQQRTLLPSEREWSCAQGKSTNE